MSKYSEMVALLEWAKNQKGDKPKRRKKISGYFEDDVSITALMHRKIEEAEALSKLLKDYEKANKKEDKKPDNNWSDKLAFWMVVTFPITAPLYIGMWRSVLH